MIPKKIHYCWFGGIELPEKCKEYIQGWRKMCPGYEIIEWNESNFDVEQNEYCRLAYKLKMWAFVSDYARLKIIYEYGGVYLDTDVELIKNIDELLCDGYGYLGFQNECTIATGLGFAAEAKNKLIGKMLWIYEAIRWNEESVRRAYACPIYNTAALRQFETKTVEGKIYVCGIKIYPPDFFNPINHNNGKMIITDNTYSIHHFIGSWYKRKIAKIIKKYLPQIIVLTREKYIQLRQIKDVESRLDDYNNNCYI